MKRFYILIIGLLVAGGLSAQSVDSLWTKANELYSSGQFKDASDIYQNIVNDGNESSDLYYNLANAYYKQSMLGKAVLYYERAHKLNPSDEDVIFNLKFARTQVLDKIEPVPTFFIAKAVQSVKNFFTADGWAILAIIFFVAGLFLILAAYFLMHRLLFRRLFFWVGLLTILLCIGSNLVAGSIADVKEAVIVSPATTIKSSPDASGKDLFILHEGTKVRILDELTGWSKVKVGNGEQGWIEVKAIEQI